MSKRRAVAVWGLGIVAIACGDDSGAADEGSSTSTGVADTSGSTTAPDPTTESSTTSVDSTGTVDESSTGAEPLSRVEQVLADLSVAMYECPDRVWPGDVVDNYRARQVLLASVAEDQAWLWNDQVGGAGDPPRVTTGPLAGLPPEWASTFNVGSINGVPTLGISLDETQELNELFEGEGMPPYRDYAAILTFHEAFHFLSDQDDWNVPGGSRSSPYPEPWEPRYLRAQLTAALHGALQRGESLEAAAHWQARGLAEFPEMMMAIRSYDVTEGSAEYASIVSSVLATLGCDATEEALVAEAVAHLEDGFLGSDFSANREPYDLGVLAGLLLRQGGVRGWELAQEDGNPPVEQLLASVPAVEQPDDPALQSAVQEAVAARNVQVGMEIDPMLEDLASPDAHRVVVSFQWILGSFGVGGFYYLPDEPGEPEVILSLNASLDPPSGVAIEVTGETVMVGVDTPCALGAGPTIVLTLPAADVVVTDGLATSTAATATFTDLAVESTTDAMGLEWLCPVDVGGAGDMEPDPGAAIATPHVVRVPASPGRQTARR